LVENSKNIKELEKRISILEKHVFGSKRKIPDTSSKKSENYKGHAGGINLLLDNGFFNKPKLVTEVQDELKKEGYYYSLQATDTRLRRDLVNRTKILTRIQVDGVWQYVIRK